MTTNTGLSKLIKQSGFLTGVVTVATVLFSFYGFYYKTTLADEIQSGEIRAVQKDVVEIKDKLTDVEKGSAVSGAEYKAMQDKLIRMETTQDKMNEKIDKLLIQTK